MKLKRISLNETELHLSDRTTVFFSYDTPVAAKVGLKYYRTDEKHSPTTSNHLNRWLEDVKCERKPQDWFERSLALWLQRSGQKKIMERIATKVNAQRMQ